MAVDLIPPQYQRDVLIYAFRYTLGRATYAPHTLVEILHVSWDQLSAGDKALYCREIRHAIDNDMAGHACDVAAWKTVLKLEYLEREEA